MIRIVVNYFSINKTEWDQLSCSSSTASFFQTRECYDFYLSLSFLKPFFFAVYEQEKLKGIIIGYIQHEGKRIIKHFTKRAIIIGGPLLSDDISDSALATLLKECISSLGSQSIYIETRNLNDYSKWKRVFREFGFDYHHHYNFHLNCSDYVEMMRRMSESKVRQVKKGLKNGATVVEAKTEEEIVAYYSVLQQLYKEKVKTPLFPVDFFLSFLRKKCGVILLIKNEDEVIGGIVAPILEGRVIYEWFVVGNDQQYRTLYPSVLATFSAMKYGCENGISRFDFMGAGEPGKEYGVRDFKSKFGGELVEHGRFLHVCNPLLYRIGKLGVKLLKKLR